MADIADDADKVIEQSIADRIAAAARAKPVAQPCGRCLNCGASELPDGSAWPPAYRWCDNDCRDDHLRRSGVR